MVLIFGVFITVQAQDLYFSATNTSNYTFNVLVRDANNLSAGLDAGFIEGPVELPFLIRINDTYGSSCALQLPITGVGSFGPTTNNTTCTPAVNLSATLAQSSIAPYDYYLTITIYN